VHQERKEQDESKQNKQKTKKEDSCWRGKIIVNDLASLLAYVLGTN